MKKIFLDTSVLVAIINDDDVMHEEAKRLLESVKHAGIGVIVSDCIFDECITTVLSRSGHYSAVLAGKLILDSHFVEFIWLDEDLKFRAWEYFVKHDDKGYSFTDCTSFVLMKELKLTYYLGFDMHFEQAGFRLYC